MLYIINIYCISTFVPPAFFSVSRTSLGRRRSQAYYYMWQEILRTALTSDWISRTWSSGPAKKTLCNNSVLLMYYICVLIIIIIKIIIIIIVVMIIIFFIFIFVFIIIIIIIIFIYNTHILLKGKLRLRFWLRVMCRKQAVANSIL